MHNGKVKAKSGLNLRYQPNGQKKGVLACGEKFSILDEVIFYRIKTADGELGYVHGDYVEVLPDASAIADLSPVKKSEGDISADFKRVTYTNPSFIGKQIEADLDFVPQLEKLGNFAKSCEIQLWITSSLRSLSNQVKGAIVKPASKSCHHVGHAIDMNIMHNKKLYNSTMLRLGNHPYLPQEIRDFFSKIRSDANLRWGGDFSQEDPVHIDDNLYHKKKYVYEAKLISRISQMNA